MRGAHPRGKRKFCRIEIDGDDRPRACQPRALHRGEPDRTTADHHHAVTVRDRAQIERGACTGHNAAADQASAVERDLLGNRNGLLIRDDAIFAETSQKHQLLQIAAVGQHGAAFAIERASLRPSAEILLAQDR